MCFSLAATRSAGQEWDRASQVAAAYQIGKAESTAALHLFKHVEPKIVDKLASLVKMLGSL